MSDKHPLRIGTTYNPPMHAFDVSIDVGGFATKAAAVEWANKLVEIMEEAGHWAGQKVT